MTIKDLAAMTGYSVGTVSRVLNNQPSVSEKARRIILKAAEESGFRLNLNAKQLKQQHSNTVVMVVKGVSNPLFGQMVELLQTGMAETDHPLMVDYVEEDGNEVRRAAQLCQEKKPLGVLFLGGNRRNFQKEFDRIDVPCVLVTGDASEMALPNLCSVCSEDRQASYMAIEALCGLGHRRFAVIGGDPAGSDTTARRYQGCMEAFAANGIRFNRQEYYEPARYSYEGGYAAACSLLDRGADFTALFTMADVMAIGAIRALRDRGLRVPEDISVMGFDGLPIGEYTVPKLATVCQNISEIALRSIRLLLENIESPHPPRHETVPVTVELRESVRTVE